MILESISKGEMDLHKDELDRIDKFFFLSYEVRNYNATDPKSFLVEIDNSFEDACFALEKNGVNHPKQLSIFEFEKRIDLIKKTKPKIKPRS